ncbi:MAG: ribose-phosphate diphosphokinase [Candidatus Coatesbacteria bacterium]|nr:ribose-phosphate diphosphokinase [Candidatus Coatesbacteria bacterium]
MLDLYLFHGNSHPQLAQGVAAYLHTPLRDRLVSRFADGEIRVEIHENVRGRDVFILQPTCATDEGSVNDHLMELLVMVDAVRRASANRVTAVVPYFGYARQDRKDKPRVPITAKLVANLLVRAGIDRLLTMELHAGQIQGYFDIPVDHLYAKPIFLEEMRRFPPEELVVVAPDAGSAKVNRSYADRLNSGFAIVGKSRYAADASQALTLTGDVKDKHCFIIDDIIATGGTMVNAARMLKEYGAKSVRAAVAHGIFAGPAFERLADSEFEEFIVTDSIPLREGAPPVIRQVSVARLLGEAIRRTHFQLSISSLFV